MCLRVRTPPLANEGPAEGLDSESRVQRAQVWGQWNLRQVDVVPTRYKNWLLL